SRLVQPRSYVPPVRNVTKRTVHENDVELVRHDATSSDECRVALSEARPAAEGSYLTSLQTHDNPIGMVRVCSRPRRRKHHCPCTRNPDAPERGRRHSR